ncbi:AAA family ATPase [Alteromonas sp. K632G]|jgi:general secretion pathway protein A|uniref:XrtA/PEP-CTERM system-associated ATPase n=1 Tax=Alteromonas sp. K632G TaxID=2820757 RepID=UPI000C0D8A77|nr:XrtA/PEP-CTERM system-associated ATPase [Alteromonas sp. K632G]MBO7922684.1 AAA family ATPase [Alteromonas sp. K632G]PHS59367.1 MAG: general secretion pathway protein GspA [Alteromonas sp.]
MYESYYGLNAKPFQLTPDPGFFFASKWHKRAMSYLQYGLSQAEGFIVITGDIGTGKTTVANSLLAEIQDDIFAAQIVTPKLSPDELVKMVASKFDINTDGRSKAEILKMLEVFLYDLSTQGRRALLLVDEAQNLPLESIEELRMLSNFQLNGKPLIQSFLLGQEELQPILRAPNMEQFRQRIVASCHLAPLTLDECKEYIEYRLHHAGWNGEDLFSEGAYERIYQFTRGVPRKINTLMDRIMLFGFLEELKSFDEEAVSEVIDEVKAEMFEPESGVGSENLEVPHDGRYHPSRPLMTPAGNEVQDTQYYLDMLVELVDALDDAIGHKVKLTQYIDKLMKKKFKTYVRLKADDKKESQ